MRFISVETCLRPITWPCRRSVAQQPRAHERVLQMQLVVPARP
jgi:hypothetical protein